MKHLIRSLPINQEVVDPLYLHNLEQPFCACSLLVVRKEGAAGGSFWQGEQGGHRGFSRKRLF